MNNENIKTEKQKYIEIINDMIYGEKFYFFVLYEREGKAPVYRSSVGYSDIEKLGILEGQKLDLFKEILKHEADKKLC